MAAGSVRRGLSPARAGPGEIRIRHHAVGLNFIDVYQRSGVYPMALPLSLGMGRGRGRGGRRRRRAPAARRPGGLCQPPAGQLFEVVASGKVKIHIEQRYALADVVQAHRDLEARRNTGSSVLLP